MVDLDSTCCPGGRPRTPPDQEPFLPWMELHVIYRQRTSGGIKDSLIPQSGLSPQLKDTQSDGRRWQRECVSRWEIRDRLSNPQFHGYRVTGQMRPHPALVGTSDPVPDCALPILRDRRELLVAFAVTISTRGDQAVWSAYRALSGMYDYKT